MPKKDERINAAKKLRKALQIALSAVELEPGDVADLAGVFDPFDPTQKYKKGEIATENGVAYVCTKTVKSGALPSTDPGHWQLVPTGTEEGGEGETPEPTIPEYDPEATYNKGDAVSFGGVTWTCNKNNVTGVEPGSDGKSWVQA